MIQARATLPRASPLIPAGPPVMASRRRQIVWMAAAGVALSGCAGMGDADQIRARSGAFLTQSGEMIAAQTRRLAQFAGGLVGSKDEAVLQEEIDELFAQPYIDPLTAYLEEHSADERRAKQLVLVAQERAERCAAVAGIYAGRDASQANLNRMQRAYLMSCPEDVRDFAARVQQTNATRVASDSKTPQPDAVPALDPASDGASDVAFVAVSDPAEDLNNALEEALTRRQNSDCYLLFTIMNHSQAHGACRPIAESGDAKAQHHMASLERSRGNFADAFSWAERSARQQHPAGQLILGQLYQAGQGTRRDQAKGLTLMQEAADSGLAEASYLTGLAYQRGQGVAPDSALADFHLQRAADKDHLPSYLALASLHAQHNPETARHWLVQAARKGSPEAQLALADSYATLGNGAADHKEAYVWYSLALLNGNRDAKAGIERQEKLLSADQLASARNRIQDGINGRWN